MNGLLGIQYGAVTRREDNCRHNGLIDASQQPPGAAQTVPLRQVRAHYTEHTITVYQAYSADIAEPAVAAGTFRPPFRLGRMTWIKPSFRWMMYRSGWASKPGQERILAISITRSGFEWALAHAALSSYDPAVYPGPQDWAERKRISPVRVQWDPERSLLLEPLPWRSIQIGLSGPAARQYVESWITGITDITDAVANLHRRVVQRELAAAEAALPAERPYPLPAGDRKSVV